MKRSKQSGKMAVRDPKDGLKQQSDKLRGHDGSGQENISMETENKKKPRKK